MADLNPFSPQLRSDPYSIYRALREGDPVYWSPLLQVWLLTRYEDVQAVLRDHSRFSSERTRATHPLVLQMESYRVASGPIGRAPTMLSLDPPAHTRMRNLVSKAFTPRVIERSRSHIQEIADHLIDDLPDPHRIDVVADFAVPLPVIVIAEILGVPSADWDRFKTWSGDVAGGLSGPFQAADSLQGALASSNELADYFREQISKRRSDPQEDLLSALVAAEDQGDLLSEDELLATCILLLVAGNETTSNLVGNGMLALLSSPDQRRRLQDDPKLLAPAIEEMLRYEGPAQMTSRIVTEEMTFRDKRFEPGQVVLPILAAANRDPDQFPEPDLFDVGRLNNRHLAFGLGIHYCLGGSLAIAEAQIAVETLLKHFPEPEAEFETPAWSGSFILRGLSSLPISSH